MGNNRTSEKGNARVVAAFLAALGLLVMSSGIALIVAATPAEAKAGDPHKSYVCKYVRTPGGGTELLQTGRNPIWVDNHSLTGKDAPVVVGATFSDAHTLSVVIIANTPRISPEPGRDRCAAGKPPVKEGVLASANVKFVNPTCPNNNTASYTTSGSNVTFDSPVAAPGASITVTATAVGDAEFEGGGKTRRFSHTFTAAEVCKGAVKTPKGPKSPGAQVSPPTTSAVTPSEVHAGLADASTPDPREKGLALIVAGIVLLLGAGALGVRSSGRGSRN